MSQSDKHGLLLKIRLPVHDVCIKEPIDSSAQVLTLEALEFFVQRFIILGTDIVLRGVNADIVFLQ